MMKATKVLIYSILFVSFLVVLNGIFTMKETQQGLVLPIW